MKRSLATLLVLACYGCEAVIGAEFDVEEVTCTSKQPPERPKISGVNPESAEFIFGALTTVDFGDEGKLPDGTPAYRAIGFDLDRVCALRGARPSCTPFGWAAPNVANGLDGIDNQAGALIVDQFKVFNAFAFNTKTVNDGIKQGTRAPIALVRITKYNRVADDDNVEVDWYVPLAYRDGNADAGPPTLAESDAWPVWRGSVDDPDALKSPPKGDYPPSKFRDANAYVTNFEVVARMPRGTPFKMASVPFTVDDLIVKLKLGVGNSSDPRFYIESGVLAGHYPVKELFRQMPRMAALFSGSPICSNQGAYPKVKRYFCAHVDSLADGRNDPDARCDALSLGVNFVGSRAQMGAAFDEPTFDGCPAETNPANDSCEIPAAE